MLQYPKSPTSAAPWTQNKATMSGVILALLEHFSAAAPVLAGAQRLAELSGAARINVLAVRVPPIATIMPTEEVLTSQKESRIRTAEHTRAAALREIYNAWAPTVRKSGFETEWFDIEARAEEAVGEWGRRADFVVLKRPWHRDPEPERLAIHAALFDTDRPVLVIPPERQPEVFGRQVAIAWRDDSRTIRSVLAALRWLGRAERIHVLAGAREGEPPPRLPDIFAEHGAEASLHVLPITGPRAFGEGLLTRAHELGADLLVMGAFVHHPARGLLLGGVTRHMLTHADLPVFMRH
jgi:nucleotide-binding universal stress UspA family protein